MTPAELSNDTLDQLLERAAVERDRTKFMLLLREIHRVRTERWMKSGLLKNGVAQSSPSGESGVLGLF